MLIQDRSWTEINLNNFSNNIDQIKKCLNPDQGFIQIVKADAYGHGAVQISKKAIEKGAVYLGVANAEEGILLRFQGITHPILILSPSLHEEIPVIIEYDLTPAVSDINFCKDLSDFCLTKNKKIPIHIKIDTGMNRNGFRYQAFSDFYHKIKEFNNLIIEGVFSHFAASENDEEFTLQQYNNFCNCLADISETIKYIHISNSSAAVKYSFEVGNLVRLGLLSYGVYTDESLRQTIGLLPVMTFKSRLSHIKIAEKGESIGYNRTHFLKQNTRYGIVPVGYADGYDFLLSNKGLIELENEIFQVIGKVSMDMITINLDSFPEAEIGQNVILIGGKNSKTSAEFISNLYHGSSYELLCQIGRRAKRYYIESEQIKESTPILRREFIPRDFSDKKLNTIIHQAIEERIQKKELASAIYHDILKYFFMDSDKDIFYRNNFKHNIQFLNEIHPNFEEYYRVKTSICFNKILQQNYFIVACANNLKNLERYFLRKDTEYRWLLDDHVRVDTNTFNISKVMINQYELKTEMNLRNECLEFNCHSDKLLELIGKEVLFTIETITWYPRALHQLTIYLTEITKGLEVNFTFPENIQSVETIPLFSGKNKFPKIINQDHSIEVFTDKEEWIFPNSGIVFVY